MSENPKAKVMSKEGLQELEKKLVYLKNTRTAEVAEQISVARGFGDLSENAEYEEAKNEQARLMTEIAELEDTIRFAIVQDDSAISADKVNIGSLVKIEYVGDDDTETFQIIGAREKIELEGNRISNESPIGAALMGKKVGDVVEIAIPSGAIITVKVLEVSRA